MFKVTITSLKSAKVQARPFSLLLLISLCLFSPLITHNAHAATNPEGTTISSMAASVSDPILKNYGTILDGVNYPGRWAGMYGSGSANYDFTNIGDITINKSSDDVYGMFAYALTGDHKLTNSGTITVNGHDDVFGMTASASDGDHKLTNSGTITVSGNDRVYGMHASGTGHHRLTNSGTITVSGNNNVFGMYVWGNGVGSFTLSNSGTMTVSGNNKVYGMYTELFGFYNTLSNSGTITVNGNDEVYGMYIEHNSGGYHLSNTGYISASARNGKAYEAYSKVQFYSIGTWATTLRTWSTTDAVFGGGANTVHLNFQDSTLILRPGTAAQGFVLGKEYNVAGATGMAAGIQGNVTGTIVAAVAEVPFLTATLTNGANPATATVRLESNVSASTTPGTTTMQQAVANVQGQFNGLSNSLRNALVRIYTEANLIADAEQNNTSGIAAGSNFTPSNKWQVFLNPYVNSVNNSDLEYNGSSMGITGGATYRVNEQFSFGGHLDFNSANYYGELMDMSTKSTSFALGLHAAYNFTPECYLRGQLTGSVNQNHSYYETGVASPLTADSTYNGEAIYASLSTGYIWQFGQGHSLTPEVGVSYLGTHTGAYDIKWSGAAGSLYDMNYADSYYNAFYGTLSLDWRSEWELESDASIALLAGLGLRQNLGNGEMETSFRTLGSNFTTKSTEDLTTFLADVGVEYRKGNFSVSLNYDGGFGTYQSSHGGNVMVKLEF